MAVSGIEVDVGGIAVAARIAVGLGAKASAGRAGNLVGKKANPSAVPRHMSTNRKLLRNRPSHPGTLADGEDPSTPDS